MVDFVLILLGHALGLDHHAALLIFRANLLKQAKTEGFFPQRELRKTNTAREVCVGMAAQIEVKTLQVIFKFWFLLKRRLQTVYVGKIHCFFSILFSLFIFWEKQWNIGRGSNTESSHQPLEKVLVSNCAECYHFPAILSWDQFSRREHSLRDSKFLHNFVQENQCNWATLMKSFTDIAIDFSHSFHQSICLRLNFMRDQ